MDLNTLAMIVDEAQIMYPKLDGRIRVSARGTTSLSISFKPRHDIDMQQDRDCDYVQDYDIYYNVLNLTKEQVKALIADYRTYINFGLEDFEVDRFGV
jgi:hypothetical protein